MDLKDAFAYALKDLSGYNGPVGGGYVRSEFLPAPPLEQQRTYRGNPLPLPSHAHTAVALAASHSRAQYAALQALHAHAEVTAWRFGPSA